MIEMSKADLNTFTINLQETSSYYVNKNKIKYWSEKASMKTSKINNRIRIKANEVVPHLTDLQTNRLIGIVDKMVKKQYDAVAEEINDLDTISREVLFSVMEEV